MPDFDKRSADRIAHFVRGFEQSTFYDDPASGSKFLDGRRLAILTDADSANNRYSWIGAQFNGDGSISQNADLGQGSRSATSGYACEMTGAAASTAIVGDLVELWPTPDGSGNFTFFYRGEGRKCKAISPTQAVVNGQVVPVSSLVSVTPSGGEDVTIKYRYGLPSGWFWEYVPCQPAPVQCCQHGSPSTVKLTVSGTFTIDPANEFNLVWNSPATGTFILDKSSKILFFDCPMTTPAPAEGPCVWSISMGSIASGYNYYFDANGAYTKQTLDFRLVYRVGLVLNNDHTSYQFMVVLAIWACGYSNPPGIIGPPEFGVISPDSGFGYGFANPTTTPSDPLNCNPIVHSESGPGGAAGFNFTVDPA